MRSAGAAIVAQLEALGVRRAHGVPGGVPRKVNA
jgi:hypothetical protein